MRILVDIAHPAHVNFFKGALQRFREEGHEVIITGLRRGKLPRILENELSQYPVHYVGKHEGSTWSIIVEANIKKVIRLFFFAIRKKIDIGISVGSFTMGTVLSLMGKPNLQFDDDPERHMNVLLEKLSSTRLYFPPIIAPHKNVENMQALKEWAYLAPAYFSPDVSALEPYGLRPGEYIFVREVSTGSLNYQEQEAGSVASFAERFPEGYPVLLSLEDKETIGSYPDNWILLQEPLPDIHSLLYYSRMIVSSGDSMAREGALLGVPSAYVGIREMKANQLLSDRSMLFKRSPAEMPSFMQKLIDGQLKVEPQEAFRSRLAEEWDDVTSFIVDATYLYASAKE